MEITADNLLFPQPGGYNFFLIFEPVYRYCIAFLKFGQS